MEEFKTKSIKYEFNEAEKAEIAKEMAKKVEELSRLEDEKKAMTSDFKSKIDLASAECKAAANKLNTGYEYRNIQCLVERDYRAGKIHFRRPDTMELVRTENMSADEMQMKIEDA